MRPVEALPTRRPPDVVDARRPGGVVGGVVLGPQRPQAEGRVVQARRRHEPGGDERRRSSRGGPVVGVVTAHAASIGRTGDQQWALSIAPAIAPWWPRNSAIVPTCVLYVVDGGLGHGLGGEQRLRGLARLLVGVDRGLRVAHDRGLAVESVEVVERREELVGIEVADGLALDGVDAVRIAHLREQLDRDDDLGHGGLDRGAVDAATTRGAAESAGAAAVWAGRRRLGRGCGAAPPVHAARRTATRRVVSRSRVRMAGILSSSIGTVPGTFVAPQRPTSTTGLRSSPIPPIVITTSSPARSVNDSAAPRRCRS